MLAVFKVRNVVIGMKILKELETTDQYIKSHLCRDVIEFTFPLNE